MKNFEFLKPPPKTKYNVLSLGAGVQSSALALMAAKGEITPMPDFAIFADTQAEPTAVYKWIDWLEKQLPFPVHRVTKGDLTERSLTPMIRQKDSKNGKKGDSKMKRVIPLFGIKPNGEKAAAIGRACTSDYKIIPILQELRKLCGIKRGQKETTVTQWIGISWDEIQRMKDSREPWTQHRFPLIEKTITRQQCKKWMLDNGYKEPPRSACYYCPFHDDNEWRHLRDLLSLTKK
jgi:3'-phosphoadenosine 5'-phosphosulfate sulfotransferase (PAPS reductase)/FAD synthetase